MKNRRNYYRLLHVQPEAPLEIIKASYRSLMTKLNVHPDRGGDHETAVLINEAYAVLSDPERRRAYDAELAARGRAGATRSAPRTARDTDLTEAGACLFCGRGIVHPTRCIDCASPLRLPPASRQRRFAELFGRRAAPRIAKAMTLTCYPSWPHAGFPVRLRDLSPTGLSVHTTQALRADQVLKLDAEMLVCVMRVVRVRAAGTGFAVHGEFLTVEFLHRTGAFVSERI